MALLTTSTAASCKTDKGLKRTRNEDMCGVSIEDNYYVVADGMGGSAGGDVASTLFFETVSEYYKGPKDLSLEEGKEQVISCFKAANSTILSHVEKNPSLSGMGCTAELLTLWQDMFLLGHVGDSRTYWFDDGELKQLTRDHSLVQDQVEKGVMTERQAGKSKLKNVLLRAVGVKADLDVDLIFGKVIPGSIFLLCTDGLYNMIGKDQMLPVLAYDAPLALKCEMLVDMANDAGGRDNISVTLVEILK